MFKGVNKMPIIKPGSDWDINGCIASAGYTWCEILGRCVRTWMEACDIPNDCLTWNDGCNLCSVETGETNNIIGVCTDMMCITQNEPFCQVYSPSSKVVSEIPQVINPFLGDGH